MNLHMVVYLLGWLLMCEGALMVLPLGVALWDMDCGIPAFLLTICLCMVLGRAMVRRKPRKRVLYTREGFVITALGWIVISVMGALPFLFTGAVTDPICALFETVSGFTTTGASILTDVEILPRSLLFWRSFTHWIGGMGVLVFLLTLLPLTGGSRINLMRAESPGPQVEKLVPKVQSTAKILYGIYILLTLLEIVLLLLGGMPAFDAVTTTFGTAGTGGFGIKNSSLAGYSPYLQNVVTVFMILFGVNFNFYFLLLLRRFQKAFSMEEVRAYLLIIGASILMITLNIREMYESPLHAFQQAAFQVASIITTTGFSTTDFDLWPEVSKTILVLLMFIGACAGSTGGGIKVSRFTILFKSIRKELHQFIHPQRVEKIVVDGHPVPHEVLRSINVFLITYFVVFSMSVLLVGFDNHDLITNFTAVAATLNNIGPGLELVGPIRNFALFSDGAKLVLIFDMLAGRLELFPLLLLFTKETWKKF